MPYFGYLLDDAIAYLTGQKDVFPDEDKNSEDESEEESVQLISGKQTPKKGKQANKPAPVKLSDKRITEQKNEFLTLVTSSLHKCFLYDSEGFVTPEKFERYQLAPPLPLCQQCSRSRVLSPTSLVPALVAQIENNSGALKAYQARVTDYLVPAISQLAVNVGDDVRHHHTIF